MSQGDELEFQEGTASDTEGEQGNEGTKNRDHPTTVRRGRKNLYCFSAIWNFEQVQASGKSCRLLSSTHW
jgi:hypothetical protein